MSVQDDFQKKVLETLKKNLKAVDLSEQPVEDQPVAQSMSEPVPTVMSGDFTAYGAPTTNGPTSGGNKDIIILPGFGGAAATSSSLINFYWNAPTDIDATGVGTSIRATLFNYATSTTNPVLVLGGYNGTTNFKPFPNYGGGTGVTAKIWFDPFLGRIETDYIGFNSGVADTNVAGVLFYDSATNTFKGGTGSGTGKTLAFTSDIPGSVNMFFNLTDGANTATPDVAQDTFTFAAGAGITVAVNSGSDTLTITTANIPNSSLTNSTIGLGSSTLALGSSNSTITGLTFVSSTTFQGNLTGTATTATTANNTVTTTNTSNNLFLTGSLSSTGVASTSVFVNSNIFVNGSTLTASTFSGTATSAAQINVDATTATRYLVGTVLNTASGSTQLSTGSGITIGSNIITATTFAGNATTATNSGAAGRWSSSRTVTFATGDVTGSFSIDGSADVSNVALTIGANSVALGTDTTGNYAGSVATSGSGISTIGTAGEGTAFTIDSNATSNNTASTLVFRDGSGNFSAGTITANLTGTASIATSAAQVNTVTDTSSTLYLLGSRASTGVASSQVYVDTNISFSGNTITATTFSGTASSALNAGTQNTISDTTSQIFFTGSRLSTGTAATAAYVLSGVSALGNTLTATTFSGSLSGTATTATNQATTTLSGTMFLHGQAQSTGVATGTTAFVGSGLSFVSTTGTLTAAFYTGNGSQLSGIVTSLAAGSGISVNSATGAATVFNTGVIALTGTANQVLVNGASGTATSGNITLTTPQSIGTASSPSFADITLSTGTNSTLAAVGSQATSLVNKQYVDNLAAGLDIHDSMRVLQATAVTANYVQTQSAGAAATGAYLISTTQVALPAIDGVTISATGTSQRVLINGGMTGTATIGGTTPFTPGNSNIVNGSYYVAALGGAGTSNWILVRTTDGDDNAELTGGTFTFIEEGSVYADSGWVCSNDTTNNGPIQFGNTAITFTQFTGGGALGVGQGLTKVGNTVAANIKITGTGAAAAIGFTQFNLGGASAGGVADTGYYPTFSVRTSGTVAGTSILTLNSDGFSLVGSTNTNRTLTVTGSDITLTGGGNTLTLTGSISLPAPTANGVAYGASASAVAFLTASGSGASVLTQTSGSAPAYLSQSQLVVGGASTAANIQGGALGNIHYQSAANTTAFVTNAAGSGLSLLSQTGNAAPVFVGQSQLVVGGATTTANIQGGSQYNVVYQTNTSTTGFVGNAAGSGASLLSQTGNAVPVFLGQSQLVVGGASTAANIQGGALGNIHYQSGANTTAFVSNAAGSGASVLTQTGNAAPVFFGQAQLVVGGATTSASIQGGATGNLHYQSAANSTAFVTNAAGSGASILSQTGNAAPVFIGQAQLLVGSATTAAQIVTDASTATRFLVGTPLNTASATATLSTGSGITIGNTRLTSGTLIATDSTVASSTSTGALIVTGGVGIGGSLWTASASYSQVSGVGHLNGVINLGVWSGTAVSLANGGTNANLTAVNGGVVYSTASAMAITPAGTANSVLVSAGAAAPIWSTVALGSASAVSGTLGISNGGTNSTATPTNGGVSYGTGTAYAFTTAGTSGSVLVSAGAAAPVWSAIGLSSSSVTGVLPIANGGNNATSYTTNGITFFDGTKMAGTSSFTYVSGAGVTATENIRAAGFNIAGNSVITSVTPSGGSAIYGALTLAVANNGSSNTLSIAGSGQSITITGPGTGITGTGTANSLAKFTATGQIGNANATDNGTTFAVSLPTTITSSALTNGTYLTITTAAGDDSSTSDFFIRGLTSGAVSKFSVDANGNLRATTKSFDIEHPTKPGKRLVYGVLEGPEHGVYHRGTVEGKGKLTVELPEYWSKLVGADYSIQLTPWGNYNAHIVEKSETSFIIQLTGDPISRMFKTIKVDYIIHGSRLDAPLQIEQ